MTDMNPTHAVLVRILIDRYEDTGKGYMTDAEALRSCRTHLQSLLDAPATDKRKDGTLDKSIAAMANCITIRDVDVIDNGPESDGDDEGRWTVSFNLIAAFIVDATTRKAAEQKVMDDIDSLMQDAMSGSIEEYACNMSCDIIK
jgi:hypothetical protein